MKVGCVRVTSKRSGIKFPSIQNEIMVDVDRSNRILGNKFELKNRHDMVERVKVILQFKEQYDTDFEREGPMYLATLELVNIVLTGKNLALRCWCSEPDNSIPCHADIIKNKIEEIVEKLVNK
jgi:hypothetical protein